MQIHLLHVNDVHSQLESYMRLGHQLRALRSSLVDQGDIVLTFDLGDVLDRVRPETEATMGVVNVDMMAALGVDGWVFGNNEGLTIPVECWPALTQHANTVVYGTNFRQPTKGAFDYFSDYHVYVRNEVRIGVFGLTPNYTLPYDMLGVLAEDPFERAKAAVQELRGARCDVIVCLSHLGRRTDHQLARDVAHLDVILGGHTHEFMTEPDWVNHTAIFQPGKHARTFGHTTITLDANRRVIGVSAMPIEVLLESPYDERMEKAYVDHCEGVSETLHRRVATIAEPLPVIYERESAFANLLADVMYDEIPGDLCVMMTGALNASLLSGDIELIHLLGACPTPTRPIVVTLTGHELIAVFNQGIQEATYARRGIGFGFRGGLIGYLVVSGAIIDVTNGEGDAPTVREIRIGGKPVQEDREYRVVTCEYLWLSPVFGAFRNARDVTYQRPLVREVLLARLQDEGRMERAKTPRYRYHRAHVEEVVSSGPVV
ncbi:5'-nucleotidase C-terminal domain-containing protein [Alicyclobacillus fastidiosus]|uniref:5'-nucleotidase C-terminal domain-containing protein n=1 Tax=Alicyclobacillus fastidiosus TaxID=392011 RepID=A0ABY6ZF96_9BACL|nr:5'-nucleotidase C-terminal domain-containing protein [Alicyclobacillus fastidiosus]WAH41580.1 5'-nucleotidase C-terminal domain-containing protein [Alicyclobacillus fastidiosus]GMA63240.1 putative metallophosphoesterase YunD [Alicyclobacillus fastidiosus]